MPEDETKETTEATAEPDKVAVPDDTAELERFPAEDVQPDDDPLAIEEPESKPVLQEKSTPEEPETQEAKEAEQPAGVSEVLLTAADDLGVSREAMQRFSNDEDAERALFLVARQKSTPPEDNGRADQAAKDDATQQAAPVEVKPFDLKLDADEIDETLLGAMNGLNEHYAEIVEGMRASQAQQMERLENAVSVVVQDMQQQHHQAQVLEFDKWVNGLAEHKDRLGQGPSGDMEQTSPQLKVREELFEELKALRQFNATMKRSISEQQLRQRALNNVLGDDVHKVARKQIAAKLKKRSGTMISPPTSRKSAETRDPTQVAVDHVAEKMASWK